MLINAQTKIAVLLKHHPDALEAIVSLSPDFKKLRNPVLRKLMAGRTSIYMASKIGGCTPGDFFHKLKPLGFEVDTRMQPEEEAGHVPLPMPAFLENIAEAQLICLDVRGMLAEGNDPLKLIQQQVKALQKGAVLQIINTFEPTPLIKLLEQQGFQAYVEQVEADQVVTYFYKTEERPGAEITEETTTGDWQKMLDQYENKLCEIDVRHLEMPMPMMTILEALEKLPEETALYVHHKRIPVFLLTELKDRGFDYRIKEVRAGEVYLLIFRKA